MPAAGAELDVGAAERLGQPPVVAERVDAEHPDAAHEAAGHLGAR